MSTTLTTPDAGPIARTATTAETRRILAPVLLPDTAEVRAPIIAEQARALDADVIVLRVLDGGAFGPVGEVSVEEALARTHLDAVAAEIRAAGARAEPLLRFGRTTAVVQDVAREHQVSMIVVARPQRKGMARLLPGDHADEIVRQAPCPVLVVEAEAVAPAGALRRFDEDVQRAGTVAPRYLGARAVEVARIVGAVTRAADLGLDFQPRRKRTAEEEHYRQVLKAMERHAERMPPVELYKLGYGYYVFSGHAQIAAAKRLGQPWIESAITEYVPMANREATRVLDERSAFERRTGLQRVGASRVGTYPALSELIDAFATYHQIADARQAAGRWYATIYHPAQRLVREQRLGEHFPGERSADLLVRIGDYMQGQRQTQARELVWQEAIVAFAQDLQERQSTRQRAA